VLRKALSDPDPGVQALAATTLANAGPEAAAAVDDLARTLTTSTDPIVRNRCCIALAQQGKEAKPAIPALVEAVKPVKGAPTDRVRGRLYEEVREQAAEAIAQVRVPDNLAAMPAIRDAIAKDKNQEVRQRCVWALFNLKELDKYELTRVLASTLEETDDDSLMVRYDSARVLAYALEDKAPDKTCDVLLHMITNDKLRIFNKTDANVEGTGNEASGGSSATSKDLGGDARYMAAEALGWMGSKSKNNPRVVAALRAAVKDKEPRLSKAAEKALKELGLEP
jgi:HEAT repeat protein